MLKALLWVVGIVVALVVVAGVGMKVVAGRLSGGPEEAAKVAQQVNEQRESDGGRCVSDSQLFKNSSFSATQSPTWGGSVSSSLRPQYSFSKRVSRPIDAEQRRRDG